MFLKLHLPMQFIMTFGVKLILAGLRAGKQLKKSPDKISGLF
jgi:hypothetical protein